MRPSCVPDRLEEQAEGRVDVREGGHPVAEVRAALIRREEHEIAAREAVLRHDL